MSWLSLLKSAVDQHWAEFPGKALLLASVPNQPHLRGINLSAELSGRKLKEAILEEGSSHLRLVQNPLHPLVWGILPTDAPLPEDLAELFDTRRAPGGTRRDGGNSDEHLRFDKAVWAAFIKRLEPGSERRLRVTLPIGYIDTPVGGEGISGIIVSPDKILDPAGSTLTEDENRVVEDRIKAWASENLVPIAQLLFNRPVHFRGEIDQHLKFDVIDFSGLSQAEKARILIPMDLLSKMKFER